MVILEWKGQIGFDLWAEDIQAQLRDTNGENVTVRFSSPGGNIMEGADIFNSLSDHKRDNPNVKMNLEIKAQAASMGSFIAASPVWDDIAIEPITMTMIHNPMNLAIGDFRDMQKSANFLKDARNLYSKIYAKASGKTEKEITTLMDAETWFMGQEIIDAGFADRMLDSELEDIPEKSMLMVKMKSEFAAMKKRERQLHEDEKFDNQRAVACLRLEPITEPVKIETPVKADEIIKPAPVGNLKTEVPMTEAELKKDNPELYKSLMKKGADDEREANDVRVKALAAMKAQEDYKDIPEVLMVIDNAIEGDTSVDAVQPLIMAAMMKIMKDPARMAAIESPADIAGGDGEETVTEKQSAEV